MRKINFFHSQHSLFPFRWLLVAILIIGLVMFYFDFSGGRLFTTDEQQQWGESNPAYHK